MDACCATRSPCMHVVLLHHFFGDFFRVCFDSFLNLEHVFTGVLHLRRRRAQTVWVGVGAEHSVLYMIMKVCYAHSTRDRSCIALFTTICACMRVHKTRSSGG